MIKKRLKPVELAEKIGICRSSLQTFVCRFPRILAKKKYIKSHVYYVDIDEEDIEILQDFANRKKRKGIYEGY